MPRILKIAITLSSQLAIVLWLGSDFYTRPHVLFCFSSLSVKKSH